MLTLLLAEPREALLIGNSNYQFISKLNNPKENLKELKTALEDLDFNVKIKTNLNAVNLEEAIELFAKRLAKNRSTTGFFYYTGHGCQVERQGYLLPININSSERLKVKHHALKIDEMIEKLKASGNRVNMFFLDACRDVPVGTKGSSKGIGQIKNTPKGTLVVYATKDGETAEDNSDFINSIISSVKEPKQSIRNLPYSISDTFKQGTTSQMPIFSAVDIPKIVLNTKVEYVKPERVVVPVEPVYVPPKPVVIPPQSHFTKDIVKIENLMWQDEAINITQQLKWKNAISYCENLTLGNYADWRLPSKEELLKLYKHKNKLQNLSSNYYWSSSTIKGYEGNAWIVDFNIGYVIGNYKDYNSYVRCVRDGQ